MNKENRPNLEKPVAGNVTGCHMVLQFNPEHIKSGLSNVFVTEIIDKINTVITKDDAQLDWLVCVKGRN